MTATNKEQKIKAALEEIRLAHGGVLRPRDVWRAAKKNKRSVLHREFEWTLAKAAERHWEDRARKLITRYVTVVITERSYKISAPYYVRDPRAPPNQQGYIAITSAQINRNDARAITLSELDRCKSAIERARNIAGVLNARHPGISDELESLLGDIVSLSERIQAAE